jgi:Tol biopolymer transport system component
VAYSAAQDGRFQIFTRSTRSWFEMQVTRSAEDAMFPFWDAGANRIYYIANRNGESALSVINAAGGTPELVQAGVLRAAQSPDGKRLASCRPEDVTESRHRIFEVSSGPRPQA